MDSICVTDSVDEALDGEKLPPRPRSQVPHSVPHLPPASPLGTPSKADLDNYFYRCIVAEEYWEYMGLPEVTVEELGLTEGEPREWEQGGASHSSMEWVVSTTLLVRFTS